ncbi:1-deoxy-D-xylulose-5-phosphate synthase [Desulfolucanica intricata]|uniref:1-deoxy-D-xylulose-5-phosphate synthase n=1 Tax=Desulfolucanica intricata TaxID=1285191 RepID=UPI00083618FA|nr:1-deoxy-D-xylulose-5-phosphate synthase [Desulfolucanica intricata]
MSSILKMIKSPRDLHRLDTVQIKELAQEIRERIIDTVSKTGGHLAPNLGVVELTLALHCVFDAPKDKIVWDVGHQCYVHKLITGRQDKFNTLRQFGGISGFPRIGESEYDTFGTGHSSTSISAALGLAIARDLQGEEYSVVAIIGDGAMTGGMAFEALNHAGHLKKDLIVILNDNEMSISPNVGAMSGYLNRIRTDPMYSKGKDEIEQLLRKIPSIGPKVLKIVDRLKDSFKYLMVPGMLFEELGFTYLGPIDGHNYKAVVNVLQQAKTCKGPVLVHVHTQKGRGYLPAENNAGKFHGVGPFDVTTGEVNDNSNIPSYTEVFGNTIVKLAGQDEQIQAVTAAMPSGTGLSIFARLFPNRFFDVGIAEEHAVTMAAGMACAGLKPVVAVYSTFLQRAFDQVIHDVCLQKLPVTFAIDRAGIVGDDGATHQGVFDLSYLRLIPNIVIMSPKDENELQHMLKTAVNYSGPAAVRYPRGTATGCYMDEVLKEIPIGQAEVVREGKQIVIIAIGNMVKVAEKAAIILAQQDIDAAVINARFIKPLDESCILEYAKDAELIITVEENVLTGGFGSSVLELLSARGIQASTYCIGIPDKFIEHGDPKYLRENLGLTPDSIVEKINFLLGKKNSLRMTAN